MTTQPENKGTAEQKISNDELSEKELEKATGGAPTFNSFVITKVADKSSPILFL